MSLTIVMFTAGVILFFTSLIGNLNSIENWCYYHSAGNDSESAENFLMKSKSQSKVSKMMFISSVLLMGTAIIL